ncbi:MAG: hypothetical protein DI576_05765 [Actinomyces sp.]|nr:MAG: hypothetical protein DI576_05765 [Actinomyces sp.]
MGAGPGDVNSLRRRSCRFVRTKRCILPLRARPPPRPARASFAEIGRVPRRDRFTSGSRSVEFRIEIGSLPRRDRSSSAPRSVHFRVEIGPADRSRRGAGAGWRALGTDSEKASGSSPARGCESDGCGQPLGADHPISEKDFGR